MQNKFINTLLCFFGNLYKKVIDGIVEIFFIWKKSEVESNKKTIFIVDDNENLANLVKYRLQENNYRVFVASNGVEGLAQLKKITPDLIILDISMPKMGGLEFYKAISTKHGKARYPVLFLTERTSLADVCKDIQADGFLPKPFEVEDLCKVVERILGRETNPTVLLIDNPENPHVQKIKEVLTRERYNVVNVDGFVEIATRKDLKKPCFILAEYMQKDIAGDEMIKKLKEIPLFADVPLIVYSYSGFKQYKMKSFYAGANRYLDAPQDYDEFVAILREIELGKDQNWINK